MNDIELRPTDDDVMLEQALALVASAFPDWAMTAEEVRRHEKGIPHLRLLALRDTQPAGVGFVHAVPELRSRNEGFARIVVLPDRRGHGVATALYKALSDWARGRALRGFVGNVKEDDPASLAWAARRGFVETGRESQLRLDLTALDPPPVDPPEGVDVVTWAERPDLTRGLYDVYVEASPDIPGDEDDDLVSFDEWLSDHMGGPGDRPEATFVALADEEVVGYSKFSLTDAQPTVAHHDLTGVKREWRGRGIAGALKRAQIAWAKERGYESLLTMNEERNEPIRRLNERLGYRLEPGRIFVRGPLS